MSQDHAPKKPSHRVYYVENPDGERSQWLELGVAFLNQDGGFSIILDREPRGGFPNVERLRLVARPVASVASETD